MNQDLSKAKSLFIDYGGSHFGMGRECVYEEYLSYGISKEKELEWIEEYQAKLLRELKTDQNNSNLVSSYSSSISNYKNYNALEPLLTFTNEHSTKLCSFSKVRYAEAKTAKL